MLVYSKNLEKLSLFSLAKGSSRSDWPVSTYMGQRFQKKQSFRYSRQWYKKIQELKTELSCFPSRNIINLILKAVIYRNSLYKDVLDMSVIKSCELFQKDAFSSSAI